MPLSSAHSASAQSSQSSGVSQLSNPSLILFTGDAASAYDLKTIKQLGQTLGHGAFGVIVKWNDYAIKLPDPEKQDEQHQAAAVFEIRHERRLLTQLSHPNIIHVLDREAQKPVIDYDDALVMDYCDGGSLRDYLFSLPSSRVSPIPKIQLASQIAAGLAYIHSKGIVHLDLKPDNILLKQSNVGEYKVVISDFGLSVDLIRHPDVFVDKPIGTLLYAAPELCSLYLQNNQDAGRQVRLAMSADIFNFAVIVYEIFHGRLYDHVGHRYVTDVERLYQDKQSGNFFKNFNVSDAQEKPRLVLRYLVGQMSAPQPEVRPSAKALAAFFSSFNNDRLFKKQAAIGIRSDMSLCRSESQIDAVVSVYDRHLPNRHVEDGVNKNVSLLRQRIDRLRINIEAFIRKMTIQDFSQDVLEHEYQTLCGETQAVRREVKRLLGRRGVMRLFVGCCHSKDYNDAMAAIHESYEALQQAWFNPPALEASVQSIGVELFNCQATTSRSLRRHNASHLHAPMSRN